MTSIDTWPRWLAIIVAGGPGFLSVVGLGYSLYMTHRHLDAIKEALKNSRYIYIWGSSLGKRGLIWSLLEMSKIAGMVMWPKASILNGELSPIDLQNFPPYLKRHLTTLTAMAFTALTWGIAAAILVKFR
ncbi:MULTISPECIES: hypothetical protein [Pseudomonas]|jgi:hypothetical protein|uniref:Uncharacterized protein n=1 Tax=Pseudomonas lactis TaxID=1615674 RepID=A0A7Y1LXP0_9PSED|nr:MULTISPECIES: hypothetical protein [Pseudomonas]MBD8558236.1 hypothetical protein [Pseudomonas fluorescens]KRP82138.1 hypothetical protein TX24_07420 [Pseudomonas lactis]MDI3252468.1 hypothetical protein [Pseudomonas sp. AL10]MDI3268312.1 hypothetical protein [Pseudomonas sp. AL15]NNA71406.1 hypothetical protein [Pseudomonas lactis]